MEESEQHKSTQRTVEKSDEPIVVKKQANKAQVGAAEAVERRGSAKGNSSAIPVVSTQRLTASEDGLVRVRAAARKGKKDRLTSLFHHLSFDLLERSRRKRHRVLMDWIGMLTVRK